MSKINHTIHEIHCMDSLSARDQWMNRVHPLVKFILTIVYISVLVSFDQYDVAGIAGMMVYPIAGFLLADLSFRKCISRLRAVLPLVCFVGILNPIFDENFFWLGEMRINAGLLSMTALILKGLFSVFASYLLIATTSIDKICYALRLLHVPKPVVTQVMLTYRYITVLLKETDSLVQAYMLRAPRQKGIHFRVWGSLAGQLLIRSIDSADNVYKSMLLRGYRGEFTYLEERISCRRSDIGYFLFWVAVILLLRRYPVILMAGNIFGGL